MVFCQSVLVIQLLPYWALNLVDTNGQVRLKTETCKAKIIVFIMVVVVSVAYRNIHGVKFIGALVCLLQANVTG